MCVCANNAHLKKKNLQNASGIGVFTKNANITLQKSDAFIFRIEADFPEL